MKKFELTKEEIEIIKTMLNSNKSIKCIADALNYNYRTLKTYINNNLKNENEAGEEMSDQYIQLQLKYKELLSNYNELQSENDRLQSENDDLKLQNEQLISKYRDYNKLKEYSLDAGDKINEIEQKVYNEETAESIKKEIFELKGQNFTANHQLESEEDENRIESWNNGLFGWNGSDVFFDKNLMIRFNPSNGRLLKYGSSEILLKNIQDKFTIEYNKIYDAIKDMIPYVDIDWDAKEKLCIEGRKLFDIYIKDEYIANLIDSLTL